MIINYKNLETIKKGHISDTVTFATALAKSSDVQKQKKRIWKPQQRSMT